MVQFDPVNEIGQTLFERLVGESVGVLVGNLAETGVIGSAGSSSLPRPFPLVVTRLCERCANAKPKA